MAETTRFHGSVPPTRRKTTLFSYGWLRSVAAITFLQIAFSPGNLNALVGTGLSDLVVFNMEVPRDELMRRLAGRQRHDDQGPAVIRRLSEYDERTVPLIDYFCGRTQFHTVNGYREVDTVQHELRGLLGPR